MKLIDKLQFIVVKYRHNRYEVIIMLYITGIHALNLNCSLNTPGDWHQSAIQWHTLKTKHSTDSIWGDYGIEMNENVPKNPGIYHTANHIRACLDLIYDGNFVIPQGMRKNFIVVDQYDNEIFEKVAMLRFQNNWRDIDQFMCKEYLMKWVRFKELIGI